MFSTLPSCVGDGEQSELRPTDGGRGRVRYLWCRILLERISTMS